MENLHEKKKGEKEDVKMKVGRKRRRKKRVA